MNKIQNYIDGKMLPPQSGLWLDNVEPATGKCYSLVPDSDSRDVGAAVKAARRAFPPWSSTHITERSAILHRIADVIESRLETFAQAESIDNGKPLWLSRSVDIPRCASNFRFFANLVTSTESQSHHSQGVVNYTLRKPLGPVACISPWNLPLYLFTWKIAPALAAGNTVIAKPSEVTPMTAFMLGELCAEAGLPDGVLNIVHGSGSRTGNALVDHDDIQAISFTGGTATGKHIASVTASKLKKISLELGGKNPNLIFADCDYELMLQTTLRSSFANQGQICLCGSRIYIQRSLYGKFREDFVARVKQLRVGDPNEPDSNQGAIVSQQHFEKVLGCIETAKREGGKVLCGGHQANLSGRCEHGWFIHPTVIEGLANDSQTNQQEIFGPVVSIAPFDDVDDAIEKANESQYGLAATIWTSDLTAAHRVADEVEAGIVWINCWLERDLRTPFGGMKQSGLGREGGMEAMRFWTEPKNVCIKF
ncbi:aldehyde dehydrogenase [Mariniblastus fucicola]|uniref:2-aminomuconic 6-semialdehyde dehydrogenase n=1 Tax=Mariniblastus fucicola TaxID=980251 RepID=A0A5B9PG51_9BACT|nr:aldehyde dehydrogenase [Mariniblastus fucicola]QEG23742.1 2-aminomuconic 6-semialdehyde dehydrogenase [Mariniblastus fucicola]